jgi:hypothetical protein
MSQNFATDGNQMDTDEKSEVLKLIFLGWAYFFSGLKFFALKRGLPSARAQRTGNAGFWGASSSGRDGYAKC